MTSTWVAMCLVALTACASEREDGNDVLPKRGERATDPTILSARATCEGTIGTHVTVEATDPGGVANLGTCSISLGGATLEDTFDTGGCYLYFEHDCSAGAATVIDLTVSNDTGGFTTASVSVVPTS